MPRSVTIQSLPVAFEMMKAMQDEGMGWGEDCRPLARQAMVEIIEDSLAARVLRQEHRIYPQAVRWFAEDRLRLDGGRVRLVDAPTDETALIAPPLR